MKNFKLKQIFYLIFLAFLIPIFIEADERKFKFIFSTEIEFEVDYGVSDLDFSHGRFYFSNPLLNQIHVCNEKGEQIKIVGRKGQGPGEFGMNSPGSILVLGEKIIANDVMGVRLQILDLDGNFLKQYKYLSEIPLLPVLKIFPFQGNEIGIYGYAMKEMKAEGIFLVHKFIIFDIEKGTHREIYSGFYGRIDPKALNPFSGFPFPSIAKSLIFQADRENYKIEVFGMESKKVNEIKRKSKAISINEELKKYFSEKEEFKKAKVMAQGIIDFSFPSHLPIIKSILILNEKLLVWTWRSWYERNFGKSEEKFYVDVFDLKGNYLGEGITNFNPEEVRRIKERKMLILHMEEGKKIVRVMGFEKRKRGM